jgi:hypothetical protein
MLLCRVPVQLPRFIDRAITAAFGPREPTAVGLPLTYESIVSIDATLLQLDSHIVELVGERERRLVLLADRAPVFRPMSVL